MEEDLEAQFTAVTAASSNVARQYLRLGGNDLEQAIQLFFANDGADLEPAGANQAPPVPATSTRPPGHPQGYTDAAGVVHLDSEGENDAEHTGADEVEMANSDRTPHHEALAAEDHPVDDDEALARRLQEEDYGSYEGGAGGSVPVDEHGYRAPIARTTQTLVGPDSFDPSNAEEMRAAVMEQMLARRQARAPRGTETPFNCQACRWLTCLDRHGIFNQDSAPSVWNNADSDPRGHRDQLSRATGGASESSSKANALAEMFRPPFELISRVSWDEAREQGKESEKWILVNIQDPSIFDCQVLNRDIWKNPGVKETVKENFIFMQYSKDDPRGSQYIQYYFQSKDLDSSYPHIAIVDPRTGEQVKVWSGPPAPKAPDFLMQVHEFLDRYSLKATARNPVARRKPEPRKETNVERMTEEQQMEMAVQASLAGTGEAKGEDPDELTRSIGNLDQEVVEDDDDDLDQIDGPEPSHTNGNAGTTPLSPFAAISATQAHTEPVADPAVTTRIQFRHPDGRIVRRFALSDPVSRIYEWLKAAPIEGKAGLEFELVFMQKNLMGSLHETIEQAGLKNGTVMVEFIES